MGNLCIVTRPHSGQADSLMALHTKFNSANTEIFRRIDALEKRRASTSVFSSARKDQWSHIRSENYTSSSTRQIHKFKLGKGHMDIMHHTFKRLFKGPWGKLTSLITTFIIQRNGILR